jgi:ABC-type protease/lipase transport system fused ATPase/permease subunit
LEGIVIDRSKQARIVLQIDILGQGAVMEIDADLLEPIE